MKTLTVELDDKTYEAAVTEVQRTGHSEAEVLQKALAFLRETKASAPCGTTSHSYREFKPAGIPLLPGALDLSNLMDELIDESSRD